MSHRKTNLIDEILHRARPDAPALLGRDRTWTYRELRDLVARAGNAMVRAGVGPGQRVLVISDNRIELAVVLLAVWRAGGCVIAGRPTWTPREVAEVVDIAQPAYLFLEQRLIDPLAIDRQAFQQLWIASDDAGSGFSCRELISGDDESPAGPTSADDDAIILFTSGSVGKPKGVIHQYRALITRADARYPLAQGCDVLAARRLISYIMGLSVCWEALARGAAFILAPSGLDTAELMRLLVRHDAGFLASGPDGYREMALQDGPLPPRLICIAGGDQASQRVRTLLRERHGKLLHSSYGTTETLNVFSDVGGLDARLGKPAPWAEVRLVGPDGDVTAPHQRGRLKVRSLLAARAYLTRDGEQPVCDAEGWFDTQDIVYFDDDGDFWIVGRESEWLKHDGIKVSPAEIEEVVCDVTDVDDARVIVLPDPDDPSTTRMVCFVVVADDRVDRQAVCDRVRDHVANALADYKRPSRYEAVSHLPMGAGGKLDRKALAALASHRDEQAT